MNKRLLLPPLARRPLLAAAISLFFPGPGHAHGRVPIRFQLDWRFEGPSSLFLLPAAKGYFKAVGLDVSIDAGSGSRGAVIRVASGAYDMGFADMAALMEFHANHPGAPGNPLAVMMVYNNTPISVLALKESGIAKPADLTRRKMGAPMFDAGRRAFPIFARANDIGTVTWTSMEPTLRETMLMRGDVDAITGFTFTSRLNLEARGVDADDIVVLPYAEHGVKMYGNAIIASPRLIKEKPQAVKAFLLAFAKGAREVLANPALGIETVKAREGMIDVTLESRRLALAIDTVIDSPDARAEGFGMVDPGRLSLMASRVSDAFGTRTRVNPEAVWTPAFLPPAAALDILPKD